MRKISRATLGAIGAMLVFAASANASIVFPDGNITKEAAGTAPVTVNYTPPPVATEGPLLGPAICLPPPGSSFPVGTTTVNCNGTVMGFGICIPIDPMNPGAGCTPIPLPMPTSGSFNVTVAAGRGPDLAVADKALETSGDDAVVFYDLPAATDPSGVEPGSVACTPGSGSSFPVGATKVTCTAKDLLGNASSSAFTVDVVKKASAGGTGTGSSAKPEPVAFSAGSGTISGSYAYVPLACPATSSVDCAGTLALTASSNAAKTIKAGTAKFKIAKGKSTKVKVKLTKQARKLLARKKRLRVNAKATSGSLQSTRNLTLKLAKKK